MDTKLTLKLDKDVINRMKIYAKKKHKSLSKIVENYFIYLSETEYTAVNNYSPLVRELSGIIDLKEQVDTKDEYVDYLAEKYK